MAFGGAAGTVEPGVGSVNAIARKRFVGIQYPMRTVRSPGSSGCLHLRAGVKVGSPRSGGLRRAGTAAPRQQ